jgi:glycosyltransferase involved in cell wall biosynthesis
VKISYVTDYDASDVGGWSGTGNFLARALQREGFQFDFIGPLPRPLLQWPILKAKGLFYNRIQRRRYHSAHDVRVARHYASTVERALRRDSSTDLVFSPGTIPIAFLDTDLPTVFWSDATHAALFDFYPEYSNLCPETVRAGHQIEQRAIDRASAVILSSDWAAQSAIRDYGADPGKVHVIPFGANLDEPPSSSLVEDAIQARPRRNCKLLFVGVDWDRKGGQLALEVAEELNHRGLPTILTIVGCDPFANSPPPDFVRHEGFLSKRTREGSRRMEDLLAESHFLIVPSSAECFGLVYCEANAYGVPCLARAVGGVPTIIKDGVNGRLFAQSEGAESYAASIEDLFAHYDQYLGLARSSAHEYQTRLNWNVTAHQAAKILHEVGSRRTPTQGRS